MLETNLPADKEQTKLAPGDCVWVVERDDGEPVDVSGFLFVGIVCGFAIVTPGVYGCKDLEDVMLYHAECTQNEGETGLNVFPLGDCYADKESAKVAMEAETGEE